MATEDSEGVQANDIESLDAISKYVSRQELSELKALMKFLSPDENSNDYNILHKLAKRNHFHLMK